MPGLQRRAWGQRETRRPVARQPALMPTCRGRLFWFCDAWSCRACCRKQLWSATGFALLAGIPARVA